MEVLVSLLLFLSCLVGISIQECTIEKFHHNYTDKLRRIISSQVIPIDIYYNCLSPSKSNSTGSQYSSMSVSLFYDSNEVRYNLQCNNSVWEIIGNQSTVLRNNNTRYCEDCTDQTVNEYHCTG